MGENAIASGFVPRDGELRFYKDNVPMYKFSIKGCEKKNEDGTREAIWFECIIWDRMLAEKINIKKGDRVLVSGEYKVKKFEGKDGATKESRSICCDFVVKGINDRETVSFTQIEEDDGLPWDNPL